MDVSDLIPISYIERKPVKLGAYFKMGFTFILHV